MLALELELELELRLVPVLERVLRAAACGVAFPPR